MSDHPICAQVADVVARGAGTNSRRGSGYLVADGWVLTAQHVVAGASKVAVWLGAPTRLDPADRRDVDLTSILVDEGADLALLPIAKGVGGSVEPALFGRLDRDSAAPVPAVAAGCPRFKLRADPASGQGQVRELHVAQGTITPASNAKTGTYELAVTLRPPEEAQGEHSPWESMSGAAVWTDQRIIGVVAQHHWGEGTSALTVKPLETLFSVSPAHAKKWREVLGPLTPQRAGDLWLVRRAAAGEVEADRARKIAETYAPAQLQEREEELSELDVLLTSDARWCWIRGGTFAGKTALLAWVATHPPPGITVVSCFLRSTTGQNTASYALGTINGQLAAVANHVVHQDAMYFSDKKIQLHALLPGAAFACQQRGRRLVIIIDGLDEYKPHEISLKKWLVSEAELPENAMLLVSSRIDVEVEVPANHPLRQHARTLTATKTAVELHELAEEELRQALAGGNRLHYEIAGLIAVAEGGLTPLELEALIRIRNPLYLNTLIKDTLAGSFGRTIILIMRSTERPVYVYSHAELKQSARERLAPDLALFETMLLSWCDDYREMSFPSETPDYVLFSYPVHLEAAGRTDDLFALLENESWYQRHEVFGPSKRNLLSGVEIIWQTAENLNGQRLHDGFMADHLSTEIRSCLTASSVASLSAHISPRLLKALLECRFWSPQQAFEAARLAPTAENRTELLITLLEEKLDHTLRDDVARTVLATIGHVFPEEKRLGAWKQLAELMPAPLLNEALEIAGLLPIQNYDGQRPRAIVERFLLARAVSAGIPDRALNAIKKELNDYDRALLLVETAGSFPADRTDEVVRLIRKLHSDFKTEKVIALAEVALTALDSHQNRELLLREVFDAALSLDSLNDQSWVLRRIAPALPEPWVHEALKIARLRHDWPLMVALVARLGVLGQWVVALRVAHEVDEKSNARVHGLVSAAAYSPESRWYDLAKEMLETVKKLSLESQSPTSLSILLKEVAPYLVDNLLRQALDWLQDFDLDTRGQAIRALLPRLADLDHPEEAYELALTYQETGHEVRNWDNRIPGVDAWADLIPHLPEHLQIRACHEALRLVSRIDDLHERIRASALCADALEDNAISRLLQSLTSLDEFARGRVICILAPHLSDAMLLEAVEMALTVQEVDRFAYQGLSSPRADALIAIAPLLKGELRRRALEGARSAIEKIDDVEKRSEATLRVAAAFSAPELATTDVREKVTQRIHNNGFPQVLDAPPWPWCIELTEAVGQFLPFSLVKQVRTRHQVSDARLEEQIRKYLSTRTESGQREFTSDLLHAAFIRARSICNPQLRNTAFSQIAPYWKLLLEYQDPDPETEFHGDNHVKMVLKDLAPHLNRDQLPEAVDAAISLMEKQIPWLSLAVLQPLAGPLAKMPREDLHFMWRKILHAMAPMSRATACHHISSLTPVIKTLGGKKAVSEFVRIADEIGNRWH